MSAKLKKYRYDKDMRICGTCKFIDEYVGVRTEKRNKPYVQAEHDFILANKDNMWQWLSSRADFHYRNHKKDKNGNLVSCEAYLP